MTLDQRLAERVAARGPDLLPFGSLAHGCSLPQRQAGSPLHENPHLTFADTATRLRRGMTPKALQHPLESWRIGRSPALSATAVAAAAGVSISSVSRVERGHRDRLSADACRRLVAAYPAELDLEELLGWSWAAQRRRARRRAS